IVLLPSCPAPLRALLPAPTRRSSDLLHRELLAGLVPLHGVHPELAQRPRRRLQARAARVTALRARRARLLLRTEPELDRSVAVRSEEHTSELQSRENLVCRLLIEKKN